MLGSQQYPHGIFCAHLFFLVLLFAFSYVFFASLLLCILLCILASLPSVVVLGRCLFRFGVGAARPWTRCASLCSLALLCSVVSSCWWPMALPRHSCRALLCSCVGAFPVSGSARRVRGRAAPRFARSLAWLCCWLLLMAWLP